VAGRRSATRSRTLEGHVRDLGHRGDGVVETEQGIVFVAGALPGERVRLSVAKSRGRAKRGRLVEVLEPAAARVEPPCALAGACGGCPLMIFEGSAEAEHKAGLATWATGLTTPLERPGPALGYRRRARLAFGGGRLGYRRGGAASLVDVEVCPVVEERIGTTLTHVRERVLSLLDGQGEITFALGEERPVVWVEGESAQPEAVYRALRSMVDDGLVSGAALGLEGMAPATFGDPREVSEGIDGTRLVGPLLGFSQANATVNRALVARVAEWAATSGQRVVELYAGNGNLSIALGVGAASLVAVEQAPAAADACRDNLAARGIEAKVITADAAEGARRAGGADVVVLDPPRTGARDAIESIVQLDPRRIVYISCDPPTLKRDIGLLRGSGYAPKEAVAFDMFPQTAHLEVVVHLSRDLSSKPD